MCTGASARSRGRAPPRRGPCTASGCRRRPGRGSSPTRVGVAGLGLDVGVLDAAGLELALGDVTRGARARLDVAAAPRGRGRARCRDARVERGVACAERRVDARSAAAAGVQRIGSSASRDRSTASHRRRRAPAPPRRGSARARRRAPAGPCTVGKDRRTQFAGTSARREHVGRGPGGARDSGAEVAEREPRVSVRRADRTRSHERAAGGSGRRRNARAVDLRRRRRSGAARGTDRRRRDRRGGPRGHASARRREHRVDDLAVAGAAAEHAAERVAHLGSRSASGVRASSVVGRHQHAGRADAALRGAVREEGLLERRRAAVARQALDGRARASLDLRRPRTRQAQTWRPSSQHRARAAVAGVAADLRAGQAERRRAGRRTGAGRSAVTRCGTPLSVNATVAGRPLFSARSFDAPVPASAAARRASPPRRSR